MKNRPDKDVLSTDNAQHFYDWEALAPFGLPT